MIGPQAAWRKVSDALWRRDLRSIAGWRRAALRFLRILWSVIRDVVWEGQVSLQAMSLVYTTMLSIVPLLAVSFALLKGLGVHYQLEAALIQFLAPLGERGIEISDRIIEFVANVRAGVLGSLGLAFLIYTIITLMQKIESALNVIWRVPQARPLGERFSTYISIVAIGPLAVFTSLGLSASLSNAEFVQGISSITPFGTLISGLLWLLPYLLVIGAFSLIYIFMPNARVRPGSALVGGIFAGLLWNVVGWTFASFVVTSATYAAIYSAFAGLIIFMLWLYAAWLIMLTGASVAFYHQHPEYLSRIRMVFRLSPRMADRLGLALAAGIVAAYRAGRPAPSCEALARDTRVMPPLAERLIHAMERAGLVVATATEPKGWMPARPPENIPVSELLAALRSYGEGEHANPHSTELPDPVKGLVHRMEAATADALAGQTLADLAPASDPQTAQTPESDPVVKARR